MTCVDPWWHGPVCDGSCAESPHGTRESTRCVASECPESEVDSQTSEAARSGNSETASDPQLDLSERQAGMSVSAPDVEVVKRAQLRLHAIEILAAHRAHMDNELRTRSHIIGLAREYGVTWREIGEALGIPESTARSLASPGGE